MRYAQGGGLTAEGRRRREQVRLEAARRFEQGAPSAVIAAELRVSERPVRRWRQAWQAAGPAGLASRGQAAQCRLDEQQLAALDLALEAGPLAAGWEDQRWTLARVRDLVAGKFRVQHTIPGIWYCCNGAAGPARSAPAGRSSATTARWRYGRRRPGRG
jgi:transposase